MPLVTGQTAQALKWLKFVLTLLQLGLSVFAIALVRFKLHGSISNDSSSGDVCLLAPPQFWAEACTYVDIVASVSMLFTFLVCLMQLYFTNKDLHQRTNNSSSSSSRKRICGASVATAAHCAVLALAALWWAAAAAVLTHFGALANSEAMPQADFRAAITAAAWVSAGVFLVLLGTEIWQLAVARAAAHSSSSSSRARDAVTAMTGSQAFAMGMLYPGQGSGYYAAGSPYGVGPVMGQVAVQAGGMAIGIPVFPAAAAAAAAVAALASPQDMAAAAAAAADGAHGAAAAAGEGLDGAASNGTGSTDQQQQQQPLQSKQKQQQGSAGASDTVIVPEAAAAAAGRDESLSASSAPPPPPAAAAVLPPSQYVLQPVRTSVRYATVTAEDLQPLSQRVDSYTSPSGRHTTRQGPAGGKSGVSGSVAIGPDSQSDRLLSVDSRGSSGVRRSSSARGPRADSRGQATLQSRTLAPAAAAGVTSSGGGAAAEPGAVNRERPAAVAADASLLAETAAVASDVPLPTAAAAAAAAAGSVDRLDSAGGLEAAATAAAGEAPAAGRGISISSTSSSSSSSSNGGRRCE